MALFLDKGDMMSERTAAQRVNDEHEKFISDLMQSRGISREEAEKIHSDIGKQVRADYEKSQLARIESQEGTINLGGKDRKMVFGMKAFRILQKEFGTLEKAMEALASMGTQGGLDLELLVTIVYAGLAIDKETTKEKVSDWLDEIPTMQEAIALVLTVANAIRQASPVVSGDPTNPTGK